MQADVVRCGADGVGLAGWLACDGRHRNDGARFFIGKLMRIAIFGTTELQTFPELADISRRHTVIPFLAEGGGDLRSWQNEIRHNNYDILHFSGHISRDDRQRPVFLHIGEVVLNVDDVVSMARLANSRGIFLNSCDSAMMANYAVRNGIACAIYTTADLPDREAWKFPLIYYEQVARQEDDDLLVDLRKAFEQVVDRSGMYGWASNGLYERSLLTPLVADIGKVYESMAEHTERVNSSLLAYESKMKQIARQIQGLTWLGGGGILLSVLVILSHYI